MALPKTDKSRAKPELPLPLDEAPAKMSRAEQRDRSRSIILSTAISLFGERGFTGVSLDEVAASAGVKRSLILYYFKSKDDLWRSAAEQVSSSFNSALHGKAAAVTGRDDKERLRNTLAASLDAFLEEPDFPRFLVREGGVRGPRLEWLIEHFDYASIQYGSPAFRERVGRTIVRDAMFAILLSMAALGPLMEASLSRAAGRKQSGIYPMSSRTRGELVDMMLSFLSSVEPKTN